MRLEDLHNQRLGRYTIIALLGRGGMAAIYRARDTALDRDVAIKVLYPQYHADTALTERFKREAIMAARLDHPNIVPIYDVGETDGLVYIAMKLLSGRSLADLLRERTRLPLPQVSAIVAQIADALDYAHSQGIIHRDIKPANILLDESRSPDRPRVLLTDFGIAKLLSDLPGLTSTSMMIGTPDYMPPELITKQPVQPQTDVYSLGVLVFRCLTGRQPFQGSTEAILLGHLYAEVPRPSAIEPALPPALDAVVLKALARNPDQRYATAGALAQALQDVGAGRPIGANVDAPTVKGVIRPAAARPAPTAPVRSAAAPNPSPAAPIRTVAHPPASTPPRPARQRSFLLPFAALALVLVLLLALIANWPPEGLQAFTGASNLPTQPVAPPGSPTDAAPTEPPAPTAEPTTAPTNTPTNTPAATATDAPTTAPTATATTAPPTVAPTQKPPVPPARTRVPPSPTFTNVPPTATETPTNTPTATLTPTATPTATPSTTPTSTPVPCLPVSGVDEDFAYLVSSNAEVRQRIGCPQGRTIESETVSEQAFQSGNMYWFGFSDTFYIFAGRETGIWRRFTKDQVNAMEGQPTAVPPAPDMHAPTDGGFALIWSHVPQVARDLGSVTGELTYTTGAWQQFDNGIMLISENGLGRGMTIYVLYENGRFESY